MKENIEIDLNLCTTEEERKACFELAKCCVGSTHIFGNTHANLYKFHGIDEKYGFIVNLLTDCRFVFFLQSITLPIDTLKFCPFMAMKYGVRVHANTNFGRSKNGLNDFRGLIREYRGDHMYAGVMDNGTLTRFDLVMDTIKLDLAPVRSGLIVGASIKDSEK